MDLSREQIIFIVLCVGFSQALFGGIMLLLKKKARLPDKILSIWLLSFALQLGVSIANHRFILTAFPVTPFIYAPLLYIYIHTLISEKPMLKKWYYLTLFPAVGFIIPAVLFRNSSVWIYENFLTGDKYIALRMIYVVTILLSFIGYPLGTFIEIHKHRQKMKNIFSYTSKRIDLSWALFVSISFFVFYFGIFVLGLIRVLIRQFPFDPELPGYAVLIFYSFVFSIFGYQQERIYPAENGRFPAYSRSGLTRDKAEKLMSDIHWFMKNKKCYLDSNLTILDISSALSVPRHYVTQALSQLEGRNFYSFVNKYRVSEAMKRLKDPKYFNLTLLAIACDCGFNSKSSFNSLFKKYTGMTPSDFRRPAG